MPENLEKKPRLVKSEGFSFFNIEYKERLLYSKYAPEKNITRIIENLEILPGTLILIQSPALFYGYRLLKEKAGTSSFLCAVEYSQELYRFSSEYFIKNFSGEELPFFSGTMTYELDLFVRKLCSDGKVKRLIPVDFSAGTVFFKEEYKAFESGIRDIISSFWKNRITLQKMARLYNRNIFKNLRLLENDSILSQVSKTIIKPVIVCGAGESLESFLKNFKKEERDSFFILCVDAALKALLSYGIKPDAVCVLESQNAVTDFFTGCTTDGIVFFGDLTTRNEASLLFKKRIWTFTRYTESRFLDEIEDKKIFSEVFIPMGSVGLYAVQTALYLRKSEDVPVYVTGLDFSFSSGKTHSNFTLPHEKLLRGFSRFSSYGTFSSCFCETAKKLSGKNEKTFYTTISLNSYAELFKTFFSNKKNLTDIGNSGLNLGIKNIPESEIFSANCKPSTGTNNKDTFNKGFFYADASKKGAFCTETFRENTGADYSTKKTVHELLQKHLDELKKAASLLENGKASEFHQKDRDLTLEITELLENKDYLFIHFPDGFKFSTEESFLKRTKAEIIYFIKQLSIILKA